MLRSVHDVSRRLAKDDAAFYRITSISCFSCYTLYMSRNLFSHVFVHVAATYHSFVVSVLVLRKYRKARTTLLQLVVDLL